MVKIFSSVLIFFLILTGCSKQPDIQDGLYHYVSMATSENTLETKESQEKLFKLFKKVFEKYGLDEKQMQSVAEKLNEDFQQTVFAIALVASPYMQAIEIKGDKAIFHYELGKKPEVAKFDRSSNQIMVELNKGAIISADVVVKSDGISLTNIRFPIETMLKSGKKADWTRGLSDEAVSGITAVLAEQLGKYFIPKSMFYESYIAGMKTFDVTGYVLGAAEANKVVGYKGDIKSWEKIIENTIVNAKYQTYVDGEGRKKLLLTGDIDQYRLFTGLITPEQEDDTGRYTELFKQTEIFGFKRNEQFATIKLEIIPEYVKNKDDKYVMNKVIPFRLTVNDKEGIDLDKLLSLLADIKLSENFSGSFKKIYDKAAQIGKASGTSDEKKVAKLESKSESLIKSTDNKLSKTKIEVDKLDMFGSALYQNIRDDKSYKNPPKPVFMFDCNQPAGKMEKLICEDFDLKKIDNEMQKVYRISANLLEDETQLKLEQMSWMATERDACDSKECLINTYANRIEQMSMSMEEM